MTLKDITDQARRADLAAIQERLKGPEMVQLPGTGRGGGTSEPEIHKGYCMINAPAATIIACYLDYDGTLTTAWATPHHYEVGDVVTATDTFEYRCIVEHDSDANNCPVTGANYSTYWTVIFEVNVYCRIFGGGYLDTAFPQLSEGDPMEIYEEDSIWRSFYPFTGGIACEVAT